MRTAEQAIEALKKRAQMFPNEDLDKAIDEIDDLDEYEWTRFWNLINRLVYVDPLSNEVHFFD